MLLLQTLFCDECWCCRPCSVTNVVVADLVLRQMLLLTLFESAVTTTIYFACVADCLVQMCNSSRKDCCLRCFMPCLKVRRRWWRMLSALPILVWRHGDYGEEHCLCCFRPCLKGWCRRWRMVERKLPSPPSWATPRNRSRSYRGWRVPSRTTNAWVWHPEPPSESCFALCTLL